MSAARIAASRRVVEAMAAAGPPGSKIGRLEFTTTRVSRHAFGELLGAGLGRLNRRRGGHWGRSWLAILSAPGIARLLHRILWPRPRGGAPSRADARRAGRRPRVTGAERVLIAAVVWSISGYGTRQATQTGVRSRPKRSSEAFTPLAYQA